MSYPYIAIVEDDATWNPTEHQRFDLLPLRVTISQAEGELAIARMDVENTGSLLALDGRRVLISERGRLLLDGVLQAAPRGLIGSVLTLEVFAKTVEPADLDAQIAALAETLKVAPYWDPLFVPQGKESDFAELLGARDEPLVVGHSRIQGEPFLCDAFGGSSSLVIRPVKDSVEFSLEATAAKNYGARLTAKWKQLVTQPLSNNAGFVNLTSATTDGLIADFPKAGSQLGGEGFTVKSSRCEIKKKFGKDSIADKVRLVAQAGDKELDPEWQLATYDFNMYELDVDLQSEYRFDVERTETLSFKFGVLLQNGVAQEDEEIEEIELRSMTEDVSAKPYRPGTIYVVGADTVYGGNGYICRVEHLAGDVFTPANWTLTGESSYLAARRVGSFFRSTRGQAAFQHALLRIKNRALMASRCVRVSFETKMPRPWLVTPDMTVSFMSTRLPGGAAEGRLVDYTLTWDGGNLRSFAGTIACLAGTGTAEAELTIGEMEGETPFSGGTMKIEIENNGEQQAELLRSMQVGGDGVVQPELLSVEVPETVIRITTSPAAATSFEQTIIVPISGSLAISKQVQL